MEFNPTCGLPLKELRNQYASRVVVDLVYEILEGFLGGRFAQCCLISTKLVQRPQERVVHLAPPAILSESSRR